MTQDEIIEMARQAGFNEQFADVEYDWPRFEAFATLVADKKQEDIIKVIERLGTWAHIDEVVNAIRGEQA